MSCKNRGVVAKIVNISQPEIVKGSDAFLELELVYKGDENQQEKISNFVGATGFFQAEEVDYLSASGSLVSADLGKIKFELTSAETAQLKAGEEISLEMSVEDDKGLVFYQLDGALIVKDRLF